MKCIYFPQCISQLKIHTAQFTDVLLNIFQLALIYLLLIKTPVAGMPQQISQCEVLEMLFDHGLEMHVLA
jgi:hypothetical protein